MLVLDSVKVDVGIDFSWGGINLSWPSIVLKSMTALRLHTGGLNSCFFQRSPET